MDCKSVYVFRGYHSWTFDVTSKAVVIYEVRARAAQARLRFVSSGVFVLSGILSVKTYAFFSVVFWSKKRKHGGYA